MALEAGLAVEAVHTQEGAVSLAGPTPTRLGGIFTRVEGTVAVAVGLVEGRRKDQPPLTSDLLQ
jgi:hypothetical protein